MRLMALCVLLQFMAAFLGLQPWLVPDLLVLGIIYVVGRQPDQWLLAVMLAVGSVMLWATRSTVATCAGYVLLGGALRALVTQWNVTDPRVQPWLAGAGSLTISILQLWLGRTGYPALFAFAAVRALLTWAIAWVMPRFIRTSPAAEFHPAGS